MALKSAQTCAEGSLIVPWLHLKHLTATTARCYQRQRQNVISSAACRQQWLHSQPHSPCHQLPLRQIAPLQLFWTEAVLDFEKSVGSSRSSTSYDKPVSSTLRMGNSCLWCAVTSVHFGVQYHQYTLVLGIDAGPIKTAAHVQSGSNVACGLFSGRTATLLLYKRTLHSAHHHHVHFLLSY